jgi:hypothetical protein
MLVGAAHRIHLDNVIAIIRTDAVSAARHPVRLKPLAQV